MEEKHYNPSEVALLHAQHPNLYVLKTGSKVFYDYTYNSANMSHDLFLIFLSGRYEFRYLSGDVKTASYVLDEIIEEKKPHIS